VLTRSISDLRTQLGAHTELTLIETIPKRGYRWVPPVAMGTTPVYAPAPVPEVRPAEGRRPWYRAAFAIVGVVLTASLMLWALGSVFTSDRIKMALLPLQADAAAQQTATELEGMLHEQLLASDQFDMLAFSATALYLQNPFPALAREYGVAYVVEGRVQARGEEVRITLNLVDARSASVIDSIVTDIPGSADLRLLGESAATQFRRHLQSSR
jgi:TolB-like protein